MAADDDLRDISQRASQIKKEFVGINSEIQKTAAFFSKAMTTQMKLLKDVAQKMKILEKAGLLDSDTIRDVEKSFAKIKSYDFDNVEELASSMEDLVKNSDKLDDMTDNLKDVSAMGGLKNFVRGLRETGALLSALKSGNLKDINSAVQNLKKTKGSFTSMVSGAKSFKEGLGGIGKAAVVMGKSLYAALGPFGIAMMAIGSLKKMFDMAVEADKFVKEMNMSFSMMKGPTVLSPKATREQFKQFNDAIISGVRNLEVGLNYKEIQEFFNSMGTSGYQLTRLTANADGYRDAIGKARKASLGMGLDLAYIGSSMGKMMTDMKADINDVDNAFTMMAFAASKSGVNTDRFLTAVTNATAGLSLYGVFLDGAISSMKAFSEGQVMGADEAAQATQDLTQAFDKMSFSQRASMVQLAKGFDFKGAFEAAAKGFGEKGLVIEGKITALKKSAEDAQGPELEIIKDNIQKLVHEQSAMFAKQGQALKAASGGSMEWGQWLPMLSDSSHEIMKATLASVGVTNLDDVNWNLIEISKGVLKSTGMSESLIKQLVMVEREGSEFVKRNSKIAKDGFKVDNKQLGFLKSKDEVERKNALSQIIGNEEIAESVNNFMSKSGKHEGKVIGLFENFSKGTMSKEAFTKEFTRIYNNSKFSKDSKKTSAKNNALATNTVHELINMTTPIEKMKDIMKDDITYRVASMKQFQAISRHTSTIAQWAMDKMGTKYDAESLRALDEVSTTISKMGLGKTKEGASEAIKKDPWHEYLRFKDKLMKLEDKPLEERTNAEKGMIEKYQSVLAGLETFDTSLMNYDWGAEVTKYRKEGLLPRDIKATYVPGLADSQFSGVTPPTPNGASLGNDITRTPISKSGAPTVGTNVGGNVNMVLEIRSETDRDKRIADLVVQKVKQMDIQVKKNTVGVN